jgi:hypothetical protein
MGELKYTPTRHRMLAEVDSGNVAEVGGSWTWGDRDAAMSNGESRVLGALRLGAAVVVDLGNEDGSQWYNVVLTEQGQALLAEWNSKHGAV